MASLVSLTLERPLNSRSQMYTEVVPDDQSISLFAHSSVAAKRIANFLSSVMWASPEMRSPSAIARKVAQPLELTYIYGRSAHLVCKENRMQGQVVDVHTFYYSPAFMLVSFLIVFIPAINILRRTGHSPLWCLLAVVPVINVIAWWYFAFKSWPTDRKPG